MDQPNQFSEDNHLWKAGSAVADSLAQFEGAMDDLVGRMEITSEQMKKLMDIKIRAENILNQVIGFGQSAVAEVKRDPKPYIALAAAAVFFMLNKKSAPGLGRTGVIVSRGFTKAEMN